MKKPLFSIASIALFGLIFLNSAVWSGGDKAGEHQPPPGNWKLPPTAVVPPTDALGTFKVQPGFRLELIAAEPLIGDPVAIAFDPDGRIYVVEMRGYMPNVDATGELEPVGRISVLEDTDGDWKMDKSTVFADQLILPRAIQLVQNGVLIGEPPSLWLCKDKDGDLKSDEKTEFHTPYGNRGANPEHMANALTWNIDNWLYSANHSSRFRFINGNWTEEKVSTKGQWGMCQDDYGRLYYNTNSDLLRADFAPSHYIMRNPSLGNSGLNIRVMEDQSCWPSRPTPGVNRGYREGTLRADGTLKTVTATCGPAIYRGDQYPDEFKGNAFIAEPSAHLVKRLIVTEDDQKLVAKNAYENAELLTSTDERNRPVNCYTGPDGCIYIVDLYRGILQHHHFLTTYLKNQILERGLDKGMQLGRIYRLVHEGKPIGPKPRMSKETPAELVAHLAHPNGWWRDTAQRLLVERADLSVLPALQSMAAEGATPLARIHALWTLEGLGKIDNATVITALADKDPKVRATVVRISEPLLKAKEKMALFSKYVELSGTEESADVLRQLGYSLSALDHPRAMMAMEKVVLKSGSNPLIRDAVLSGLSGREVDLLDKVLVNPGLVDNANHRKVLVGLAAAIFDEGNSTRVTRLLDLISAQTDWRQPALLEAFAAAKVADTKPGEKPVPAKGPIKRTRLIEMMAQPVALAKLTASSDLGVKTAAQNISKFLNWPEKSGKLAKKAPVAPLTEAQKEIFEIGKAQYAKLCIECHQPTGLGMEGKAPPLVDSPWALGNPERIIRIVLHGMRGPINVKGTVYTNLEMPSCQSLDDRAIAGVLTYIRREWGHEAGAVDPAMVAKIRKAEEKRGDAWTEEELLKIK